MRLPSTVGEDAFSRKVRESRFQPITDEPGRQTPTPPSQDAQDTSQLRVPETLIFDTPHEWTLL